MALPFLLRCLSLWLHLYIPQHSLSQNIHYLAFDSISNLVVESAGTVTLALNGSRTVSNISDLAEAFHFYLDSLFIKFVVRFLNKPDSHSRFEEILPELKMEADGGL